MNNNLVGIWKTDSKDSETWQNYGNVTMEFKLDGQLIYTIIEEDKEQKIILNYEVQGTSLITDQPSFPQKQITEFVLTGHILELIFDGIKSKFIKVE